MGISCFLALRVVFARPWTSHQKATKSSSWLQALQLFLIHIILRQTFTNLTVDTLSYSETAKEEITFIAVIMCSKFCIQTYHCALDCFHHMHKNSLLDMFDTTFLFGRRCYLVPLVLLFVLFQWSYLFTPVNVGYNWFGLSSAANNPCAD